MNDSIMKKIFCLVVSVIVLVSCGQSYVAEKPDNLIEEDRMVNMLYDLSLLQASYSVIDLHEKKIDGKEFLKSKYGIDSLTFAKSHKYYASQPEKYQKMQKQIVERLEAEKLKLAKSKDTTAAVKQIPIDLKKKRASSRRAASQ